MTIAWVLIAIGYGIVAIKGIQVPAWEMSWLCLFCSTLYFEKIFNKGDK
jgi:hypothetical protein